MNWLAILVLKKMREIVGDGFKNAFDSLSFPILSTVIKLVQKNFIALASYLWFCDYNVTHIVLAILPTFWNGFHDQKDPYTLTHVHKIMYIQKSLMHLVVGASRCC